jgi:hypothetical protein
VNHRLPQFLGTRLTPSLPYRDFMSHTIILEGHRMGHGDIRRPLLKAADWITPRHHDVAEQRVSFCYRTGGSIDEVSLHTMPRIFEADAII